MMPFELQDFHRNISDSDLNSDLRAVSEIIGRGTVTFREYNEFGKYHASTISERFGSWSAALKVSNLDTPNRRNIPDEELFHNLVEVWQTIGKQPSSRDLTNEVSRFSWHTYANRFGGWRAALDRFVEWANASEIPSLANSEKPRVDDRRTTRNINWRLRALVLMRDGARCQLCGADVASGAKLHVDHIVPWSKGGETELENLQILCEVCNIGKSNEPMPSAQ
jgi:hypothetical protein